MQKEHLNQLVELCSELHKKAPQIGGVGWSAKNLSLSLVNKNIIGLIMENTVVAFVAHRVASHAIEVDYVATHSQHHQQGYMSIIFKYLKDLSLGSSAPIWLEVSENNRPAVRFYKKMGFIQMGVRKNYYKNGQEALIYSFKP